MKNYLHRAFIFAVLFAAYQGVNAQYAWDFGVHLGGANYLGEMGGKDQPRRDFVWDMKLGQTRWAVGAFARRRINRLISVNSGIMYLRIQGRDDLTDYRPRRGRNLNFRNDMFEWYIRPEFTIYQDNDLGGRGKYRTDIRIFGYAGLGIYYHRPMGRHPVTGELHSLRPLQTELVDYSPIGVSIPAGIGLHFTKSRRHRFGFDFNWRTTFTDYLDDASTFYVDPNLLPGGPNGLAADMYNLNPYIAPLEPELPNPANYGYNPRPNQQNIRGDPTHNDSYLTLTLTYSYVLRGQSNFYRQRYNWIRGSKRIGRKSRAKF